MEKILLLVDDEPPILSALSRLFQGEGYRLLTANSGEEALRLLETHDVHVILTDQRMPGMTGVELLTMAKAISPASVRMVLSGYADLKAVTDAVNHGNVYKFLSKPWVNDQLVAGIRDAFEYYNHTLKGEHFSRMFEDTEEGVMITNPQAVIQMVNPAFTAITGYLPDESLGNTPAMLKSGKHPPEFFRAMWSQLHETGKWSGEIHNRRKNGQEFIAWINITSIKNALGQVTQHIGIFDDITEHKREEERLSYQAAYHDALLDAFQASQNAEPTMDWTAATKEYLD